MLLRKVLVVLCALSLILSLPLLAQANNTRLSGMGLSEYTTDWMVQDPGNIFYNPANVNLYSNYMEVNSIDNSGSNPNGVGILNFGNTLTFGISLNNPLYSSYLNGANYAQSLPFTFDYTSAVTAPTNADTFSNYKATAFGGFDLGAMKLGVLYAYGAGDSTDQTISYTDPNNANSNTTQTIKNSNSQSALGAGILLSKLGPIDELGVDVHYFMPSMSRTDTRIATSALNYTRSVTADSASELSIGANGTCKTSSTNALIGRVSYVSDNCKVTVLDKEDLNGNGVFTDAGDKNITDNHTQTYSAIQIGLVDQYKLMDNGFIFVGATYNIINSKQTSSGSRADLVVDGPNYTDPYEFSYFTTSLPVIIGGEFPVANWLKVRFSASKTVLQTGTNTETLNTYTSGTTLVDTTTTTTKTANDYSTTLNLGANVTLGKVGIDWLVRKQFVSDGGLLSSEYGDSLSTKFTVSVKL